MRVFRPRDYQPARAYAVLYLLHGYGQDSRQWPRTADCAALATHYQMVIICPDGFRTWYLNSPRQTTSRFEDFFFRDLVPVVHQRVTVAAGNVFISGLSMGGYGALNLYLARPEYFAAAGSTSGAVALDYAALVQASQVFFQRPVIAQDLTRLLGDPLHTEWDRYSIAWQLRQRPPAPAQWHVVLDCGTEDPLLPMSNALKVTCDQLGLPLTYTTQPGDHNEEYWKTTLLQHLAFFNRYRH